MGAARIAVGVETGSKRSFAFALDWPGWCRPGKTEAEALAALAEYTSRYASVAKRAKIALPANAGDHLEVVERLKGGSTTDFGAPEAQAKADLRPMKPAEAERLVALLRGAWTLLDKIAAAAPSELRKGPRGGGRDRDKILAHVLGAEQAYAAKLAVKVKQPTIDDTAGIRAMRKTIVEAILAGRDGSLPKERGWPARYAARRIAWHALDHTWEIEDRSS